MCSCLFCLLELKELEAKRDSFEIPNEESITAYYKIRQQLKKLGNDLLVSALHPHRVTQDSMHFTSVFTPMHTGACLFICYVAATNLASYNNLL